MDACFFLVAASVVAGLVAASAAASAQGAPVSWNGPSIGVLGGGAWGSSHQADQVLQTASPPPPLNDGSYSLGGGSLGIGAGYAQMIGGVLLGVDADFSWTNVDGSSSTCGGNHLCGTKLSDLGTVRARAGLPMGSDLVYLTGGAAGRSVPGSSTHGRAGGPARSSISTLISAAAIFSPFPLTGPSASISTRTPSASG